jgi:hypothetical protein
MGKLEKINVYQNLQDSYTDYVLASWDFAEYFSTSAGEEIFIGRYTYDGVIYIEASRYVEYKNTQWYYTIDAVLYQGEEHLENKILELYDSLKFEYSDPLESSENIQELENIY